MIIHYTERFIKSVFSLPSSIQDDTIAAIKQLEHPNKRDLFHVYPLEGRFRGLSAFSINFAYQAIAVVSDEGVILLDVTERVD